MRNIVLVLVVPPALLALLVIFSLEREVLSPLHQSFLDSGKRVLVVSYECPADSAGLVIRVPLATFKSHELYLREKESPGEYLLFREDGTLVNRRETVTTIEGDLLLIYTADSAIAFANGKVLIADLNDYDVSWVTSQSALPEVLEQVYPRISFMDRFRGAEVATGGGRALGGDWALHVYGADGVAAHAPKLQTVRGSGQARLHYGAEDWFHYHAEASFYFGVPPTGPVVDQQTVPVDTDMLVIQGEPGAFQVAFGWQGATKQFVLMTRQGSDEWVLQGSYSQERPPLSNWYRLGLQVRDGLIAEGYLDGVKVVSYTLPQMLSGGFSVQGGMGTVECGEVKAWSLPRQESAGQPYEAPIPAYTAEQEFDSAWRPVNFLQAGVFWKGYQTMLPLPGDFGWEPLLATATGEVLEAGRYRMSLLPMTNQLEAASEPVASAEFTYRDGVWTLAWTASGADVSWQGQRLRLVRQLGPEGGALLLVTDDGMATITSRANGPLFLRFAYAPFTGEAAGDAAEFSPEHIQLTSAGIVHDGFDTAPVDWRWVEGAFRMEDPVTTGSNRHYLAGGGVGVPFMSGRRSFSGAQIHQFSLALRPATPWDAGDDTFAYDPAKDAGLKRFHDNQGWYESHDLNFSFCTDGVNPMSGYAVIMGGRDNTESVLYRRGVPVQRLRDEQVLLRPAASLGQEPDWWRFTVVLIKSRVQVYLRDELLFDYDDASPIQAGHLGFWTVRNRFAVSGLTSLAEKVSIPMPHLMFVPGDTPSPWVPLQLDEVAISRDDRPGTFRVTGVVGGGFKAIRYHWPEPVSIRERPLLSLPLSLSGETALHLYLEIDDHSYLIRIYGPIGDARALLTPLEEAGEQFRLPILSDVEVRKQWLLHEQTPSAGLFEINLLDVLTEASRAEGPLLLRSITLGNSSNTNYLLAGNSGNRAGAAYTVGIPVMRESAVTQPKGLRHAP